MKWIKKLFVRKVEYVSWNKYMSKVVELDTFGWKMQCWKRGM